LQQVEKTGNIAAACRELGFARSQYYTWKRRFDAEGEAGLRARPPIPKSPHPATTTKKVDGAIQDLSIRHPSWGCVKLAEELRRQGISVSSPTVQKILIKYKAGKRKERCAFVEGMVGAKLLTPTAEQIAACERVNPRFREREKTGVLPGYRVVQDTIRIGKVKGIGPVLAQVVIDTATRYVWLFLHLPSDSHAAIDVFERKVRPKFKTWDRGIILLETSASRRYGRRDKPNDYHEYVDEFTRQIFPDPPTRRRNGFIEAFAKDLKKMLEPLLRRRRRWSLEELQAAVEVWVADYNRKAEKEN